MWTIGHSRHEVGEFIGLLERHGIQVLVDVRSAPFSKIAPQFNQQSLETALARQGIDYLHLGGELGGRPDSSHFYDHKGHVLYNLVAQTPSFNDGIQQVLDMLTTSRVALMCSEGDPSGCHRTLLVGRVLQRHGIGVINIFPDGSMELSNDLNDDSTVTTLFGEEEKPWISSLSVRQASQQTNSSID